MSNDVTVTGVRITCGDVKSALAWDSVACIRQKDHSGIHVGLHTVTGMPEMWDDAGHLSDICTAKYVRDTGGGGACLRLRNHGGKHAHHGYEWWPDTQEDYVNPPQCESKHNETACTKRKGHTGRHVHDRGFHGIHVTWDKDESERLVIDDASPPVYPFPKTCDSMRDR